MGQRKPDLSIKPYTPILKHVNKQTFASTVADLGEAIPNPAYREGQYTGMLLRGIKVIADPGNSAMAMGNDNYYYVNQLQIGDRSASPAILDPDSPLLVSHFELQALVSSSSGKMWVSAPWYPDILWTTPVVVQDQFTIYQDATNIGVFQSKDFFTIVYYQLANIGADIYNVLLAQQTRTS